LKELDTIIPTDKFTQAGINAEKQMAFYLAEAFGNDSSILVLNGLRLKSKVSFHQIDHLIIHKYGMIIIESKSVTGKVFINKLGEWSREFKSEEGMPSPIKQAERQAVFLKDYLDECPLQIAGDFGSRRTFKDMPVDVLVAISDKAIIKRDEESPIHKVFKADQISDEIKDKTQRYKDDNEFFGISFQGFSMNGDTRERIGEFLIQAHTPRAVESPSLADSAMSAKPDKKTQVQIPISPNNFRRTEPTKPDEQTRGQTHFHCRECDSTNIIILWGKYGYYFKCNDCKHNTPINQMCPRCNLKLKIRKEKDNFYAECTSCHESNHFYTNPT
jgi:hypothetical protein